MKTLHRVIGDLSVLAVFPGVLSAQNRPPSLAWEIGAISGSRYETWGRISSAAVDEKWIVAYDVNVSEVRVFDAGGHYLRSFGRPGNGPGDFAGPVGMEEIRGDTLVTLQPLDRLTSRFLLTSGEHLVTRRMDTHDLRSVRDSRTVGGTRFYLTNPFGGIPFAARLYRLGPSQERPDTLLQMRNLQLTFRPKNRPGLKIVLPPAKTGPEAVARFLGDSSILILDGIKGTLSTARLGESRLDTVAQVDLPEKGGPTTPEQERRLREYSEQFKEVFQWDELYVPDMTSAWAAMILDGESAVWIKRNGLLADVPETWMRMRFDHPGVFQRLTFPPRVAVKGVHGNRVVAVRKGEYDEEYLQLYQVEPWGR